MKIVETSTGKEHLIEILPVERWEFDSLKKRRYFFDWRIEQDQEVYKLQMTESGDILGLVSLERIPEEWRIHIRLLTVSRENKGTGKMYDKIAGNLLTHVAKIAVRLFGSFACVSLKPKTRITRHYIEKYRMNITGNTLSLEVPEILDLIKEYDHD
jgi:hypothetical protein